MLHSENIVHLKNLIERNELHQVFSQLNQLISHLPIYDEIIILKSNFSEIKEHDSAGILTFEQKSQGLNKIKYKLLNFLSTLQTKPNMVSEDKKLSVCIKKSMKKLNIKVETLTKEQFRIIEHLRYLRKVRISGCAGSGKTIVAAEKSIRLAKAGIQTLFLCHNPLLAKHVQQLTKGTSVKVFSFGEWINTINQTKFLQEKTGWNNYFEPTSTELENAFDNLLSKKINYEAIVVDEAQDFRNDWWTVIEAALIDAKNGILYIFHDDNQALLPFRAVYPIEQPIFNLSRNCRNAGKVYEFMRNNFHYQAPKPSEEMVDEGRVNIFEYEPEGFEEAIIHAISWMKDINQLQKTIILLPGNALVQKWEIENLEIKIPIGQYWQKEVKFRLVGALISALHKTISAGYKSSIIQRFDSLSRGHLPSKEDIMIVNHLVDEIQKHLTPTKNQQSLNNRIYWKSINGEVKLFFKKRTAALLPLEIITFFQKNTWANGLFSSTKVKIGKELTFKKNYIPISAIPTFKGLEADGVILVANENNQHLLQQLYVGVSRARSTLAIVTDKKSIFV